ncbi:MAG: spore germination protein [Clostridia bacterium]|nr:spore germination protein [Clostridia bacterium]
MKQAGVETAQGVLSDDLDGNIAYFRDLLHADVNSDAHFRPFMAGETRLYVIYIEGMASDQKISDFILRACAADISPEKTPVTPESLMERVVEIAQCDTEDRVKQILDAVVSGMTAVLVEGASAALILETRGYPARPVDRTTNESVVLGAQEGFVESLRTNMTLLRRYLPSPHLVTEALTVGTAVPCRLSLVYLSGVADPALVDRLRARIKRVDVPTVMGSGALEQLIEDKPSALLPQILQTERPDRVAACLADGQVALLADNSPCALVMPVSVFHLLHAPDDAFARWQYGSFLRLIRVAGMLLSVFLPGLYIAMTDYHMHLIPMSLLVSISEARVNVPFPILVEILIMEFAFYLINEAGTRMPRQIGGALGIVGALILGQAAVAASIISPILIIIVAITGLGSYATPDYSFSIALVIYRLFVILAGALLGLYGICIAGFCITASVCGMRSLGVPYTEPVAPPRPHNPDLLLRLPTRMQRRPMPYAVQPNWMETHRDEA